MRILVCGGRDFADLPMNLDGNGPNRNHPDFPKREAEFNLVISELDKLAKEIHPEYPSEDMMLPENMFIISGAARGADTAGIEYAIVNWIPFKEYPADWDNLDVEPLRIRHRKGKPYNVLAGMIRNKKMLDEGKPDLVLAFPGGTGTAHMVGLAKRAGVEVREIKWAG